MTASGFLDADPLCIASSMEYSRSVDDDEAEQENRSQHVFSTWTSTLPSRSLFPFRLAQDPTQCTRKCNMGHQPQHLG
jgi:nuclear pore complex protein Nup188